MNTSIWMRLSIVCISFFTLCLLTIVGCGGGDQRKSLQGTVSFNGQPLSHGRITFRPIQDTGGPTAGAKIVDGQFTITPDQGTFSGMFRVEITAWRKTGRTTRDPDEGQVPQSVQYIPQQYNAQSELRAEVTIDGPNKFNFQLHGNVKP